MRNWEQDLSPIARERLATLGELTQEEKDRMVDSEKVTSLLAEFYQGQINPESLWKRLKEEGKPSLLREAQVRLVDSLSFGVPPADVRRKREGILAIETLKEEQNTSVIEFKLNRLEELQRRYRTEIDRAYDGIRAAVEKDPRLRMKQVRQGQNTIVVQLTVDEAIKQLPQWQDFLSDQAKRYSQEFASTKEELQKELR